MPQRVSPRQSRALRYAAAFTATLGLVANAEGKAPAGVQLTLVGQEGGRHATALAAALNPPLLELGATLTVVVSPEPTGGAVSAPPVARGGSALALFRLDVRDPGEWRLYISDPQTGQTVVRFLPGPARDGAVVEAVAAVVGQATSSLMRGPSEGKLANLGTPVPAEPTTESARKAPTAYGGSGLSLALGAGYRSESFAGGLRSAVPAMVLAARGANRVSLSYVWAAGTDVDAPEGTFRLKAHPVELALGHAFRRGRWALAPEVIAVAESRVRQMATPAEGFTSEGGGRSVAWGGGVGLDAAVTLTHGWAAHLTASAVHFFGPSDVVVARGENRTTLFSYEATRFRLGLTLTFRLF